MLSRLLSLVEVTAIAHRGGSKLRPENTLAAFDHASALGVDGLECDVHLSRDGEPVVIHDPTLDRTTDCTGPVGALTVAELRDVDAGHQFTNGDGWPYRQQGIGVPQLRDVLTRFPHLPVVVEVKGNDPEVGRRTVEVIRECGASARVIVGGFNHAVLTAVRQAAPNLITSASLLEGRAAVRRSRVFFQPRRSAFQLFQMPFRLAGRQTLHRSFVRVARRGRLPVQAWIVDAPEDMRRLIDWGVTGIISDRPDVAVEMVKALGARA